MAYQGVLILYFLIVACLLKYLLNFNNICNLLNQ